VGEGEEHWELGRAMRKLEENGGVEHSRRGPGCRKFHALETNGKWAMKRVGGRPAES
jgi:hypothetical protein